MDTALFATGLASAAFVISHLGLSAAPLRDRAFRACTPCSPY